MQLGVEAFVFDRIGIAQGQFSDATVMTGLGSQSITLGDHLTQGGSTPRLTRLTSNNFARDSSHGRTRRELDYGALPEWQARAR